MAASIRIKSDVRDAIIRQALQDLPHEACGYLLADADGLLVENHPMTNADHSAEHFSFIPEEQFAALKHARSQGLRLAANWHSHPSTPARPSEEDIRLACDPRITYLILSLAAEQPVLNAYSIVRGQVTKLDVSIE